MPLRRKGRGLKMIPAGHLAAMAAGATVRAVGRSAAGYLARASVKKAAIAGAVAGAAGTAATMSSLGKRGSGNRAGGYTSQRGKKYARTGNVINAGVSSGSAELSGPLVVKTGRVRPLDVNKLTAVGVFKRILRWQDVNAMNRTAVGTPPGAIQLKNVTTATETECPCHFICLNSTINTTTGITGAHYTLQVLDNGTLNFAVRNSRAPGGGIAANAEWQQEWRNNISSGSTGKRYILPQWYDIRLLCYGAKTQPTRYEISLIKFTSDYLDPLENPSSPQEAADRQAVFQNLAQTMMYNPILPSHGTYLIKNKIKVIKRVVFTIQPTLTTEADPNPNSKIIKMFVPDGKVYDYLYHLDPFTAAGADDKLNTQQWVNTGTVSTDFSEVPKASQRIWLMIRALDTTVDAVTEANTPSYDLVIRKKEVMSPD